MRDAWQLFRFLTSSRISLIESMARAHGDFGRLRIGRRRLVLVNTPEMAQEILVERGEDFVKSPGLRVLSRPLLGDGLLTAEGEDHLRQRRLVAPAFAHQRIMRYAGLMSAQALRHMAAWQNGRRDLLREMNRLTLAIVGEALFGANLQSEADEIGAAITTAMQSATTRMKFVQVPLHWNTPRNLATRKAIDRLNQTVYRIIQNRRESGDDKGDLLSMLLMASEEDEHGVRRLSDQQVRDEAMTLLLAGHETTANAVTWSLYLLASNPAAQRRLHAEADHCLGPKPPEYADLTRLPYALRVFKEAMRLYPPAYIIGRQAIRPAKAGRHAIEAGEIVLICPYLIHRDARYFPEPLRFDPDRFLPEREAALPKFAYFPFGGGRRICIGNQFALMEGQILLAALAARWAFAPVSSRPPRLEGLLTLRPKNGMPLDVHRRNSPANV